MLKQQRREIQQQSRIRKSFFLFLLASIVVHCVESEEYKLPFPFRFRFYLHMKSRSFCSHIIVRSLLLAPIHYSLLFVYAPRQLHIHDNDDDFCRFFACAD